MMQLRLMQPKWVLQGQGLVEDESESQGQGRERRKRDAFSHDVGDEKTATRCISGFLFRECL
eukprot:scaffold1149_cov173-Skeletonema_marinoi.AAC.7